MSDENDLKRYLGKRINTVIREISTPVDEITVETFHRLRVEIKKIRALISLIAYVDGGFKKHTKKYFEPFKPLFKKAGKVRQLQMEEEIIHNYWPDVKSKNNAPVAQLLLTNQKKQKKAIATFEEETGRKTGKRIDKTAEKIEARLGKVNPEHLMEYNKHAKTEIKKLVEYSFTKRQTHDVRKKIKELLYNLKLTVPADDTLIKQTDHLQDVIGKWHDGEAALIYLEGLINERKQLRENETAAIKKAIKKIAGQNKTLFKRIDSERKKLKRLF